MFGFINFHLRLTIAFSNLLDSTAVSSSFLELFAFACLLTLECFQIDFVVLHPAWSVWCCLSVSIRRLSTSLSLSLTLFVNSITYAHIHTVCL